MAMVERPKNIDITTKQVSRNATLWYMICRFTRQTNVETTPTQIQANRPNKTARQNHQHISLGWVKCSDCLWQFATHEAYKCRVS